MNSAQNSKERVVPLPRSQRIYAALSLSRRALSLQHGLALLIVLAPPLPSLRLAAI
jgi:hypothetical protein